jgi:hypothetical protein
MFLSFCYINKYRNKAHSGTGVEQGQGCGRRPEKAALRCFQKDLLSNLLVTV